MTSPTNGGWQHTSSSDPGPPPSWHAQWPASPPPLSSPSETAASQVFAPTHSGAGWTTQQVPSGQPPYGQQPYPQQPPAQEPYAPAYNPQPLPYAGGPGNPWIAQPAGQGHGAPQRRKNNKLLVSAIAVVVVAALIGGGLFFFLSGTDITYQGRDIVEPDMALAEAESTLNGIVEARHGAANDATSCYFVAKSAQTSDVEERVVCGPVLFVDGDEGQPYLTFPLQVSSGDGDARVSVASEPDSPDPAELADPALLRRPDSTSPPEGSGGLAVPEPPRADGGVFTVVPSESIELESTPDTARIGSPTMSIDVSAIGVPERYGRGDDARRPAEGEKFVGFEITSGPGETGPVADFSIAVQTGDDDPIPLPDDADLSSEPVDMVISVPQDDDDVNLVVTEGALLQSLSLTNGAPDPANVAVWRRANRNQQLAFSQGLTIRASQPGFVTEDFPATLVVNEVVLTYYAGPNGDRAPSAPSQAFLVLDAGLNIDGQTDLGLDPPYWSLTLPNGTVLPAADLHDDPTLISIAFDVPANFTGGTLNFGGVLTSASGLTFDSLGVFVPVPIAIPQG